MARTKKMSKDKEKSKAKSRAKNKLLRPGKGLTASGSDEFRKKLLKIVDEGVKEIVIDFAKVKMLDSVGLGVIIAAHNSLKRRGGRLKLKNVSEENDRLFKTTHLDQHFQIESR